MPLFKLYTLWVLIFTLQVSTAQEDKYDYIWPLGYFPNIPQDSFGGTLLNFHYQPRAISYVELANNFVFYPVSTISNKLGELILYTNGCQIINREHEVMLNGDTINPGYVYNSYCSTGYPYGQGLIVLPLPGNDSLYYLFHLRRNDQLYITDLMYSIVNANGDNGLGEVTEKNILLFQDNFVDQLQAVRHGNGRDWWIVVPKVSSTKHFLFLLSPHGIDGPIEQQAGVAWNAGYWSGQAIFSPDGSKYIRVNPTNGIHIFDFDRCSGALSNPVVMSFVGDTITATTGAGVSVSPNGRYLYASLSRRFYQYDLQAANIAASRQLIGVYDGFRSPFATTFYQHMLAPDGKIYITSTNSVNRLHVIHNPNGSGTACNLEQHGIRLPALHIVCAPNFPHFRLYDLPNSPCDTLGISTAGAEPERQEAGLKVFPNPADGIVYIELPMEVFGKLRVWNADGKIMYEQDINDQNGPRFYINTLDWPSGIYFGSLLKQNGQMEQQMTFVIMHD